ncbi:MAG: TOBE domain-containing protein [Chloroflexota bacterium]|nr:TOBE domain-containing protein [Chloroflexota bacterium]
MLSARNRFKGRIKEVRLGQVMAEVIIAVGDLEVVSLISRTSAERMGLKVGDEAAAVVKATEVMVEKG